MPDESAIHREHDEVRALPANVTFDNLIRANKRKSTILMILMVLLLVVLGGVIGGALVAYTGADVQSLIPSVIIGAIAALIVGILGSLWSYYNGSKAILKMAGAHELDRNADPQLYNVVEELSIAAGTPMPTVYVIPDDALNAFATGRDPEHSAVAITTALREQPSRDELAAVMAHEPSHVRNYDIRFMMLMATMVGLIVFISDAFLRTMFYGGFARGGRRGGGGGGGGNPIAIVLLLAVIAPFLALMIRFAVSREREYLADAGAVELTRYPQGMISALEKLGASQAELDRGNRATAHLYIVNPMKMKKDRHEFSSVFRTHPPLHERIERLRALIT